MEIVVELFSVWFFQFATFFSSYIVIDWKEGEDEARRNVWSAHFSFFLFSQE